MQQQESVDLPKRGSARQLAGIAALACMLVACASELKQPQPRERFLQKIKNASITIYPTVVAQELGSYSYDQGSASQLGQFAKTDSNIRVILSAQRVRWTTPQNQRRRGGWREGADALRSHIADHGIDTDYAALAVYGISSGVEAGVQTIYFYLADANGDLVRRFQIDRKHQVFVDANPKDVSDCTPLLIETLKGRIQLMDRYESLEPMDTP